MPNMNLKPYIHIITLLVLSVACTPNPSKTAGAGVLETAARRTSNQHVPRIISGDLVLGKKLAGRKIDPARERVQPKVVSFKDDTEVIPADPNVEPAIVDKVIPIPQKLPVFIPGKEDVPPPDTVVVQREVLPIPALPPIPASMPSFKDWATGSIQYLGRQHGFEIESVTTMLKDSRGHLWFGSAWQSAIHGVSRYDGVSFTNFPIGQVGSILEDTHGRLWFGALSGPICYDGHSFTVFKDEPGLAGARAMLEDRQGNLWIGTPDGLYRHSPAVLCGA